MIVVALGAASAAAGVGAAGGVVAAGTGGGGEIAAGDCYILPWLDVFDGTWMRRKGRWIMHEIT